MKSKSLTITTVILYAAIFLVALLAVPLGAARMGVRPGQRRPNRVMSAGAVDDETAEAKRQEVVMDLACHVEYFPPPDEHLFCCRKTPDCECPRRMGICAEEEVEEEEEEEKGERNDNREKPSACETDWNY